MKRTYLRAITQNGAWLILPPLAVSFCLWGLLPAAYSPEVFWQDVPAWLGLGENALRVLVFAIPFALCFETGKQHRAGWQVYAVGLALYAASYLLLVFWPASRWATSLVGFTAPGWTTTIFFLGIAWVCRDSWLDVRWKWWFYLVPMSAFLVFHLAHTALIWSRQ